MSSEETKHWFPCGVCRKPVLLIKAAPKANLVALAGQVLCECGQISSFGTPQPLLKNPQKPKVGR